MDLRITPICLGIQHNTEKSVLTYLKDQGTKVIVPHIMWLIEGGEETIIVDSGPPDPEIVLKEKGRILERAPEQSPLKALEKIGIDPAKIKIVIATHLHWDHCANFDIFRNAEIYVQRRELEFAVATPPVFREVYDSPVAKKIPKWLKCISRFKMIEGDIGLIPNIRLIHIPGHTPGLQGVSVITNQGAYFITSDAVNLFENWEEKIPPGIHINIEDCYSSFRKIESLSDHVLPAHDLKVLEKSVYP
jgi:glyoxylase-like metal-dependent hydrolase (beta-lactamase superfamily II)